MGTPDPDSQADDERAICEKCVHDDALKRFVANNASARRCDYCGRRAKKSDKIAAPAELVIDRVMEAVAIEYADPNDELPWEGGWQGNVIDGFDMIWEIGSVGHDDFDEEIQRRFGDSQWCRKDYFSLRRDEVLKSTWDEFKKVVKHQNRFFFLQAPDKEGRHRGYEEIPPAQTLEALGDVVERLGLVRKIPIGRMFFRARVGEDDYRTASDLGPPPVEKASYSNRMSPAGISMFYGGVERATALAEVIDATKDKGRHVTSAAFRSTRPLRILNLASIGPTPTFFDVERAPDKRDYMFVRDFAADIAAPISKDGREHIDYVPTQVVTEYFRTVFRAGKRTRLDGIKYRSSRHAGGHCVVLFADSNGCAEPDAKPPFDRDVILQLESETIERDVI